MDIIFLFPGQSSRYAEMVTRIRELSSTADTTLDRASAILGRDLRRHYSAENPAVFATNRDIQVGVFLANHLHLELLQNRGIHASFSVGLSLGEYNHLVHIGALDFEDALRLVDARGIAYDRGPEGMMACVFPLSLEELQPIVERARVFGVVEIGGFNSPTQHVLSGECAAVEGALRLLEAEHVVECVIIEQRVPMHSSVFAPVLAELGPHLQRASWKAPVLPYLPNAVAELLPAAGAADFVTMLSRHVHQPVRWRESIELLVRQVPAPLFLEVGPRTILTNLLSRKWGVFRKYHTEAGGDPTAAIAHWQALTEELTRVAAVV